MQIKHINIESGRLGSSLFHLCLSASHTQWQELPLQKAVKNSPGGTLFNKTQSVFGLSPVEFVLSGCRGGVERVQRRRAFARTPVGSWGSRACGQNHQLLPDVIRSLQQLCLASLETHKHTAGEGIRAPNMSHNQKEKATGDFLLRVKCVLVRLNMWVSESAWGVNSGVCV